jgi:hypothetical protein
MGGRLKKTWPEMSPTVAARRHPSPPVAARRRPSPPVAARRRSSPPVAARRRSSPPVATRRRPWLLVAARRRPWPLVAARRRPWPLDAARRPPSPPGKFICQGGTVEKTCGRKTVFGNILELQAVPLFPAFQGTLRGGCFLNLSCPYYTYCFHFLSQRLRQYLPQDQTACTAQYTTHADWMASCGRPPRRAKKITDILQ